MNEMERSCHDEQGEGEAKGAEVTAGAPVRRVTGSVSYSLTVGHGETQRELYLDRCAGAELDLFGEKLCRATRLNGESDAVYRERLERMIEDLHAPKWPPVATFNGIEFPPPVEFDAKNVTSPRFVRALLDGVGFKSLGSGEAKCEALTRTSVPSEREELAKRRLASAKAQLEGEWRKRDA